MRIGYLIVVVSLLPVVLIGAEDGFFYHLKNPRRPSSVETVDVRPDGVAQEVTWLRQQSATNVMTGRFVMKCGVVAYPPQAKKGYHQFFLRDYAYILEGCADVIPADEMLAAAKLFVRGITDRGEGLDCVFDDGRFNYKPGGGRVGDNAVIDGAPFTVDVVYLSWRQTKDSAYLRPEILDRLVRAMEKGLPRNPETKLAFIRPKPPPVKVKMSFDRAPYGFTDVVRKEGDELFTSLLDVESSRRLTELLEAAGRSAEAATWRAHADVVAKSVNRVFWDEAIGLYRAATVTCREHDVWGSAFAVYLGVADDARALRISQVLKANYCGIVQNGQVRHLLPGVYWQLVDCGKDKYQNGGYWGTASGWVMFALAKTDEALAKRMAHDLVRFYREKGIPEWSFKGQGEGHLALEGYLSSSTLPLAAMRRLGWDK